MRRRSCAGPAAGECGRGWPEVRRRWRAGNSSFAFRRRRPRAGTAGRVASGPGAARRESDWFPADGVVRREGRLVRDPGGPGREVPWANQRLGPEVSDGRPACARLPEETERLGCASGGDPELAALGPERRGAPGASRCAGSRGDRENWEWPLSERGGRWGDPGRPGSGVTRSGGKAPSGVRTPPPNPREGQQRSEEEGSAGWRP